MSRISSNNIVRTFLIPGLVLLLAVTLQRNYRDTPVNPAPSETNLSLAAGIGALQVDLSSTIFLDLMDTAKAETFQMNSVLESDQRPVVLHSTDNSWKLTILTTDFEKSDFTRRVSFVVFVSKVMEFIAGHNTANTILEGDAISTTRKRPEGYLDAVELPNGQQMKWPRNPTDTDKVRITFTATVPGVLRALCLGHPMQGSNATRVVNPILETKTASDENLSLEGILDGIEVSMRFVYE